MEHLNEMGKVMGYDQNTMNQVKKMIRENPKMIETMMANMASGKGLNPKPEPIKREKKIKPNQKCPCDSGKKYKKCCGGNQ